MKNNKDRLLDNVNYPSDIKNFTKEELSKLSDEIRECIVASVRKTGGHFASNLGVVELTVALHYVFDAPKDKIIWDVGHQAYAHKVLTGRKNKLETIRKKGGLKPFPSREESEYDAFGVGHSSTSIGAGIGMALAQDINNPSKVISVIGDGALGGGMAFEALNHGGEKEVDMLVILNDNKMSISPNVGGLSKYLTRLISSPSYTSFREKGKKILSYSQTLQDLVRRTETHAKGSILPPGTLFEELGWSYFGPIDAHDIDTLVDVLSNLKSIKGPKFLHIISKKGNGCEEAMNNCTKMHAISGENNNSTKSKVQKYTNIFTQWILEKAETDKRLHAITPAMSAGSGLEEFAKKYPDRYHDVGIAEQHAVTLATGLACEGKKPVVAIYSTFLQRAYDQFIHDVAIQNLDILFAIDRAGVVGPDGATHAGSFDISFLRIVPNVVIMTPVSGEETQKMLDFGYEYKGVSTVRYPRGGTHKQNFELNKVKLGKAQVVCSGEKIAILAFGHFASTCFYLAKKYNVTLVNMRFIKPLDTELLEKLAKTHQVFLTIEDNVKAGGAGSAVNEFVLNNDLGVRVFNLGLPDRFQEHASREELLSEAGLDEQSIEKVLKRFI